MKILNIIILFVMSVNAQASLIIHDNLGSGDSYNPYSSWTIGGSNHDVDSAQSFVAQTTSFLTDIWVGIGLINGENVLDIGIYSDDAGEPNELVESFQIINAMSNHLDMDLIHITASGSTLLTAETRYWLVASASSDTWAGWGWNSIGELGTNGYRYHADPWITGDSRTMGAFRIAATEVPEPATKFLLLIGLIGLVGHRRVRKG